jgi:hypothetical protein
MIYSFIVDLLTNSEVISNYGSSDTKSGEMILAYINA